MDTLNKFYWSASEGCKAHKSLLILLYVLSIIENGPIAASFCIFLFFSRSNSNDKHAYNLNYIKLKSIDVVLGIRTRGHPGMAGADDSTELSIIIPSYGPELTE